MAHQFFCHRDICFLSRNSFIVGGEGWGEGAVRRIGLSGAKNLVAV